MAKWVRLCALSEIPGPGNVAEVEVEGATVCLANIDGELSALDNICPHRQGPLGQGWIESGCVVCPWHSWMFHAKTGESEYPRGEHVTVYPLRTENDDILVEIT